jgi:hypothetical protein
MFRGSKLTQQLPNAEPRLLQIIFEEEYKALGVKLSDYKTHDNTMPESVLFMREGPPSSGEH